MLVIRYYFANTVPDTKVLYITTSPLNSAVLRSFGCCYCYRAEVSNKIHELRHRMEEQMNSRRQLEAQLHNKETQKMEEFRSKVTATLCRRVLFMLNCTLLQIGLN